MPPRRSGCCTACELCPCGCTQSTAGSLLVMTPMTRVVSAWEHGCAGRALADASIETVGAARKH
eukprot:351182-Chlamydomonas_euryale.AAC.3